jgi:outer membrane protein
MKKFFSFLVIFGLIGSFSFSAFAKELKIGYVDIFEVFNEYEKTKDYDKNLEKKKDEQMKKLDEKKAELEKLQNKLSVLKKEEQEKKKDELAKLIQEWRTLERQILTDLRKEKNEKMEEIIGDINNVIKDYAQKNNFDFIINGSALLFGNKSLNITADILKLVNEKYKKK